MEVLIVCCILFHISTVISFAQQKKTCRTDKYTNLLLKSDPENKKRKKHFETQIKNILQSKSYKQGVKNIITIPVVVHIVYNIPIENLSEAQIKSQIDVLNEDFRRLNTDTGNTRSFFKPVASDAQIEFCLAARDPNGCYTNGITRTQTTVTQFGTGDSMKFDILGGKDAWPRNDYLNIWVCNLVPSTAGYAQFPWILTPSTDGIVVDYGAFGRIGNLIAGNEFGRTTTHEVGHWLGLFHNFAGGACVGTSQLNCNLIGDQFCDTPPQSSSIFGCPSTDINTCIETPVDKPDMYENFMDYSDDDCKNLFTQEQTNNMRAVLYGSRISLQSSQGCISAASLYPVVENFESPTFPTQCWSIDNPDGNKTWEKVIGIGGFGNSNGAVRVDLFSINIAGQSDYLISPHFDFTNLQAPIKLEFNIAYAGYDATRYDTFTVEVSDDGGHTWQEVLYKTSFVLTTAPNTQAPFIPTPSQWRIETIFLDTFQYKSSVTIRFLTKSGRGNNLYLDDINISGQLNFIETKYPDAIELFPNPSEGKLLLKTPFNNTILTAVVYNILGEVVFVKDISSLHSTEFDFSQQPNGLYFIILKEKDTTIFKRKIIITKTK